MANADEKKKKRRMPWEKRGDFFGSLFGYLIILAVANLLPKILPHFFTDSYPALLWVINVGFFFDILVTVILIFFSFKLTYYIARLVTSITSIIISIVMITIFPFDFSTFFEVVFKLGIYLSIVVSGIAAIVYLFKSIFALIDSI
jgi:hypothetical protein